MLMIMMTLTFNSSIGHFSQLVWAETYKVMLMVIMTMFVLVIMFVIMMRVMFNDHHNDRLAAVLRPTAKVSATQHNCPHTRYDVMSLHSKESGFQRCTLATTPPTATSSEERCTSKVDKN